MNKKSSHRMYEILLSKDSGKNWYHYLWIGDYFDKHIKDEDIISKIERQHDFLNNDKTIFRVRRDS